MGVGTDPRRLRPTGVPGAAHCLCSHAALAPATNRQLHHLGRAVTLLAAATLLLAAAPANAAPGCRGSHWVGAWAASPSWAAEQAQFSLDDPEIPFFDPDAVKVAREGEFVPVRRFARPRGGAILPLSERTG